MSKPEVKFGEWIEKGFNLYKDNWLLLSLATLVAYLLSMLTIGILAGPLWAGMIMIIFALMDKREPKPEVGDVFKGFSLFLQTFLYVLVTGVGVGVAIMLLNLIPCLGSLLGMALAFAVGAATLFSMFLIVDRKMEFWPAIMASYEVVKGNFWPFLGFSIVVGLIAQAGFMLCCVGGLATIPIAVCSVAVAYRDVFGVGGVIEGELIEVTPEPVVDAPVGGQDTPPPPPPPPPEQQG